MGRASGWRLVVGICAIALLAVWLTPKIRLHALSAGITNNTWNHEIVYRSSGSAYVVTCMYYGQDSASYWESGNGLDEDVCSQIPVYLHEGLPPVSIFKEVNGRRLDLRAPLVWGRLL